MNPIRTLKANEIDCRVSQIKKTGLQLLLYKDARCDMAILDETFGPMNWQRRHTRDNANCVVSIWDADKKQWIEKEDTGTESNTEAEKGLASDSFKRACVNVGIGRELYTAPFIWINAANCEIKENGQRLQCFDRFAVSEIGYNDNREIDRLTIINAKSKSVVFEYGSKSASKARPAKVNKVPSETPKRESEPISKEFEAATREQLDYIRENASDTDYMDIMQEFGADMERMSKTDAARVIEEIKDVAQTPTCERCGEAITGIVLPDGSTMTASELIGKSKLNYKGIYCFECMKALKAKRKGA